jgi:mono/diheme cytochrome c family protein
MQFFRQLVLALLLAGIFLLSSTRIVIGSTRPAINNASTQASQNGEQIFTSKCTGCHTIGNGNLVGPDLKDVTQRRSLEWLVRFISNPKQVIDAGDKEASKMVQEFNGLIMPASGLTDVEVGAVIEFLGGHGRPMPAPPGAVTGVPGHGEKLFTGGAALINGGTACNACHTVAGVGVLGGGALGPDLTHAFTKYGGAAGLSGALASLPFPTMRGIFAARPLTPAEQADLLAFLQQTDQSGPTSKAAGGLVFLLSGLAGAVILFGILLFFWPKQRQSLSEKLRKSNL